MRKWIVGTVLVLLLAVLAYLHDPPWLVHQTVGLRPPQVSGDGMRFQWTGKHAAFYLPSTAGTVRIPVATSFDDRSRDPMIVTFWLDDVRAARVLLSDPAWHDVQLTIPPDRWRRLVRVDVRTSVVRPDNHGVEIGEMSCCSFPLGSTR